MENGRNDKELLRDRSVDACRQAIAKAQALGFDVAGSVMASDAFFPFPDCVEIAHKAGVTDVVQPEILFVTPKVSTIPMKMIWLWF